MDIPILMRINPVPDADPLVMIASLEEAPYILLLITLPLLLL